MPALRVVALPQEPWGHEEHKLIRRHGNGGLVVVDQAEGERKRRLSLWSTGRKDHDPSGETKFKLEMPQSITDAISTGANGGMGWNKGCFAMS